MSDKTCLYLWSAAAAVLAALCAAAVGPAYLNHDAAWYLHMVGVWLDGGTLYRSVIDTNPPLIVFLTAVPVLAARMLALFEPMAFKAFVFVAAGLSTGAALPSIRRLWTTRSSRFLLASVYVFLVLPFVKDDFGQREHLAIILAAPFILSSAAWAAGRPLRPGHDAIVGVFGGLGLALKPHLLLGWLAVEACLLLVRPRSRSVMRPGSLGAAGAVFLYGAVILLFVPEYFSVAREVAQVYGGLNASAAALLRLGDLQLWIAGLVVVALLRLPRTQATPCLVLFAAATGCLVAAMFQLKGWAYHLYPYRVFVLLFFASAVAGIADSHAAALEVLRGGRRGVTAAIVSAAMIWSARYVVESRRPVAANQVAALVSIVQQYQAESLAVLSMRTIVYPAFPTVNYTDARWVTRHHSLWFLPGLYERELEEGMGDVAFHTIAQMPPLERQYFEQILDDLCAQPPRLLVVEPPIPGAAAGRRSLDLVAYYRQDQRFDRLFAAYTRVSAFASFVVYRRPADASCGNPRR